MAGEYSVFSDELRIDKFNSIILIGYSFFSNGLEPYDSLTLDHIREYIINHDCKVVIIDPNSSVVADILSNSINRVKIICYPVFWNKLCYGWWYVNMIKRLSNIINSVKPTVENFYIFIIIIL